MLSSTYHPVDESFRRGRLDTAGLILEWAEADWDTVIIGNPVLQINRLEVRGPSARQDIGEFEHARDVSGAGLVSCRLPHDRLRESMLLESIDFRFIEMLYQPELKGLQSCDALDGGCLSVMRAGNKDLPAILAIAGSAFRNERFHVDPRLPSHLGDRRYQNWVRSSLSHPSQELYLLRDRDAVIAFFVTELLADGTCYWHLNAVVPDMQGRGYGKLAWSAMLSHARKQGAESVRTSIVARNHRVLNLYARLGFRFSPPLMTFHWVRT